MSQYFVVSKVCVVLVVQGGREDMAEAGPPGEMERRVSPVGTPDPPPPRWPLPPHTLYPIKRYLHRAKYQNKAGATLTLIHII